MTNLFEKVARVAPQTESTFSLGLILKNLAQKNPDILISDDGNIRRYQIRETNGHPVTLSALEFALNHTFERNPKFQRESDEHKNKTAQQIVADYLCGQKMGYISCYVHQNTSQPKLVIDGKHRLTHLEGFLKGNIVLRDKEAAQFWAKHSKWLLDNFKGDVKVNKLLKNLQEGKSVPPVKYTDLPNSFQSNITSQVTIEVMDISIECYDENDNRVYDKSVDPNKVEELYYRKFLRINQNSANMKPEDIIWGCGSEYNIKSRQIVEKSKFFDTIFNISTANSKDLRKLNDILFSTQLFLDEQIKWGSGGKSFVGKINDPSFSDRKIHGESIYFSEIFLNRIIPHFENYFRVGNFIKLPDGMKGIQSKGTNIKYMLFFMYKIHQMYDNGKILKDPIYYSLPTGDMNIPTKFLTSLIEIGSSIIVESCFNKDGILLIENQDIQNIYNKYPDIFNKIAEFRRNSRNKEDMDTLFEKLVHVCCQHYTPTYSF